MVKGLVFVIIIASFSWGCKPPNQPATVRTDLKIAYNVLVDSASQNYDIYLMNADGSDPQNLTDHPSVDWVYHSDDHRLYFVSDRDTTHGMYFLYQLNPSSKEIRKIFSSRVADSWIDTRKDGKELIICQQTGDRKSLILIDDEGYLISTLLSTDAYDINDPSFINDDTQVAFRSSQSGIDEIWTIDIDGQNLKQLTFHDAESAQDGERYHAGPPRWNPAEKVISYMCWSGDNYDIKSVNLEGIQQIVTASDTLSEGWHSWSADGKWLTFGARNIHDGAYNIYIKPSYENRIVKITSDPRPQQAPVFVQIKASASL